MYGAYLWYCVVIQDLVFDGTGSILICHVMLLVVIQVLVFDGT